MTASLWPELGSQLAPLLLIVIDLAVAIILALIVHTLIFLLLGQFSKGREHRPEAIVIGKVRAPTRWINILFALAIARKNMGLSDELAENWALAEMIIWPALFGWLVIACLRAAREIIENNADISVEDNLAARRRRTRSNILTRIAIFVVIFICAALMLLAIPGVRNIGVSLLASAGLAGLAVGAAAQPALKNLIAGIQMAFTEPIRIDDAIIIANEWGWVEEIRLTYVVVKVWDERRLIVPVSKFLEEPFQNWTYRNADLLGSVFLYLDPETDVGRLREHFEQIITEEPLWDGRAKVLQVTDTKPEAIEIRMLATARNSPIAFDLRCSIREKMLDFIRSEMPEAIVRVRNRLENGDGEIAPVGKAAA